MSPYSSVDHGTVPTGPKVWPKVIGIISIVWGSFAVACGTCIAISKAYAPELADVAAKAQAQSQSPSPLFQVPDSPMPGALTPNAAMIASELLRPVAGALLLAGGVMLLRRRMKARSLHLGYAGVSLMSTALGVIGAVILMKATSEFIAARPDDEWALYSQKGGPPILQLIVDLVIALMAIVYPVFVLSWFLPIRRSVDALASTPQEPLV